LPEQHRLVIVLRYWYDMSYQEIAQITSSTESAVKSRLHRARGAMADALQADASIQLAGSEEAISEHAISEAI